MTDLQYRVDPDLFQWLCTIRRYIHRYPELGFGEEKCSRYIQDRLTELAIPFQAGVAGTGVVATLGPPGGGKVLLRADMDGLPITEKTGLPYASVHQGVMHACGHDGHVAMLLGAAALLKRAGELPGRVELLFQPAEESGRGAARMIREGVLSGGQAIFAGHIDTHYPTGIITVDEGIICAWADPFTIKVTGRSGHAARPHEAADAIVASASLVSTLQTLVSRETNPNHAAVVTIGRLQAGVAHNVIAAEAVLEGTLRATNPESRERTMQGIRRIVEGMAVVHGVTATVAFGDSLPAVVNSVQATGIARRAAERVVGPERVISQGPPSLGGEDFSFYQQDLDGCLVRFGATPPEGAGPSHSATYAFSEQVLATGAEWLACVALEWFRQRG